MASILYLHGFASGPDSFKARLVRTWADEHGIQAAFPNLNGENFSTLTLAGQLRIANGAMATLRGPVLAVGSSLGGYLSTLLVEGGSPIAGTLLMAPAFDFARRLARLFGREAVQKWRQDGKMSVYHHSEKAEREVGVAILDEAPRYTAMPEMPVPCTIVHGLHDVEVPVELSRLYARDNHTVKLVEVEDDHTLLQSMPRVALEMERMLKELE